MKTNTLLNQNTLRDFTPCFPELKTSIHCVSFKNFKNYFQSDVAVAVTKVFLILGCFLISFTINAQVLFGTAPNGGLGAGTIAKYSAAANTLSAAHNFDYTNGENPKGSLIQASNGKLYGMTFTGGSSDAGVIFSFDPVSSAYGELKNFDNTSGTFPYGNLLQASDGKLYGMTSQGGSNNYGVIFSFDPYSLTYTKLKDFDNTNGGNPRGSLIQASNGKLYGMTTFGGSSGSGVIFSFDPVSSSYIKLMDFNNTNGANPYGSLMQASNGKLYGMASLGGTYQAGVIFSFDPASTTFTKLIDLSTNYVGGNSGVGPTGNLIQATDGYLYGMTPYGGRIGGGVIFFIDLAYPSFSYDIHDFAYDINGDYPYNSLIQASNGKLYGTTAYEGSNNAGVIFSFDPVSYTYTKLQDFNRVNGANPVSSLVEVRSCIAPNITVSGNSPLCEGETLQLTASSGASTYQWSGPNGFTSTSQNPVIKKAMINAAGTYILTAGNNLCNTIDSTSVIINPKPAVPVITASSTTICSGGSVSLASSSTSGNQWYRNNKPISGANQQQYTATLPGNYNVVVTNQSNCKAISAVAVITAGNCVFSGSSAREFNIAALALSVKATPNPSSFEFTLTVQSNSNEEVRIAVMDIVGKKLYESKGSSNSTYKFGSRFKSGTYIVQVIQGTNMKTLKVIKGEGFKL